MQSLAAKTNLQKSCCYWDGCDPRSIHQGTNGQGGMLGAIWLASQGVRGQTPCTQLSRSLRHGKDDFMGHGSQVPDSNCWVCSGKIPASSRGFTPLLHECPHCPSKIGRNHSCLLLGECLQCSEHHSRQTRCVTNGHTHVSHQHSTEQSTALHSHSYTSALPHI